MEYADGPSYLVQQIVLVTQHHLVDEKSELILETHHDSLSLRVRNQVVLAIQDASYFKFDALVDLRQGIPRKRFRDMHGIIMHHGVAVSTDGLPYRPLNCKIFDRDIGSDYGGHYDHQKIPIEKKKIFRWIEALRATSRFSQDANVKFVKISDRECDIYEFLHKIKEIIFSLTFLVTSSNDTLGLTIKVRSR